MLGGDYIIAPLLCDPKLNMEEESFQRERMSESVFCGSFVPRRSISLHRKDISGENAWKEIQFYS